MTLAELATEVAAGIAECPDFVALKQVQRATAELMDKCRLWRRQMSFQYPGMVPIPDGAELAGFIQVKVNGRMYAPTQPGDINDPALQEGFWMERGGLQLVPRKNKLVWVDAIAYLSPLPGVELPDGMLNRKVCDAIQNGARHYLFQVPSQPWYSMQSADYYGALFTEACIQLRNQADRGFVDSRCRTKPHFF
ncbi:hypothetical protein [Chromobacterium phragmitis]|uniref:Uncharacterized protein n=1 Tax=Chromobacterium phragmitis TaxID=2202141 RepID=A0A344UPI8_9NEIS|nr:hypothetical protein [Chromobacterium phragmitis]AXE37186.1 hypothetical protein DK843_22825 [Chromobacterium phragmitis]